MSDLPTKSAKEEELDLIFAEEFSCDPNFTLQYFREAFPAIGNVKIEDVAIQPKLHDGGYGDLLVLAKANGKSHALLIEHKISAGPAPGQAERYRNHATHLLRSEGRSVVTALVAPRAYRRNERVRSATESRGCNRIHGESGGGAAGLSQGSSDASHRKKERHRSTGSRRTRIETSPKILPDSRAFLRIFPDTSVISASEAGILR